MPSATRLLIVMLAVVGQTFSPQGQTPPPPAPTGAISGIVKNAVTGEPVEGATVSLGDLDNRDRTIPQMVTDAKGRFVFHSLPASDGYYLDARAPGYAHTRYGWSKPGQSLTIASISRVRVTDGLWVHDLEIPVWQLGRIEGRVIDERNEPVVGVAVRAYTRRRVAGLEQWVGGPIATTDDRGIYRFVDLDPGGYVVGVLSVQSTVLDSTPEEPMQRALGELATGGIGGSSGAPVRSPTIDVDGRHRLALTNFATPPPPGGAGTRAYPPVFYPASSTPFEAQLLDVAYGAALPAIDLQLQPVATARVSGRLVSPVGTVDRPLLRLLPAGGEQLGFGAEVATTVVGPDGSFTFLNVPAGNYTLLAQASVMDYTTGSASTRFADAPGFPGGGISVGSNDGAPGLGYLNRYGQPTAAWARMPVSVSGTDIENLTVAMRRTSTIRGRVVFAEGSGILEGTRIRITAESPTGDPSLGEPATSTQREDPTGVFELTGLLGGRYLLRAGPGLVSVTHRGEDVTYSGLDTSAGTELDDVVITLTDEPVVITGTVNGRPDQSAAAVIAFPADRSRWTGYGLSALGFRTTRSGSDGAFKLDRLPAGDYYVVAVDAAQIDAWLDPGFLGAVLPYATQVTLAWGDTRSVTLTLAPVTAR